MWFRFLPRFAVCHQILGRFMTMNFSEWSLKRTREYICPTQAQSIHTTIQSAGTDKTYSVNEPIGHRAKERNEEFQIEYAKSSIGLQPSSSKYFVSLMARFYGTSWFNSTRQRKPNGARPVLRLRHDD